MSRGRMAGPRARLRHGGALWWDAVSSGRFFTLWCVWVGLPLAVVVLAPYNSVDAGAEIVTAQLAALLAMLVVVPAFVPIAWAERRLRTPALRGALVLVALVAGSIVRPMLNEAFAVGVFGLASDPSWTVRAVTNLVAWTAVLSLVAITEQLYSSSRLARRRLVEALRTVTDEQRRAGRYERESHRLLEVEVRALRAALRDLLLAPLDFDRVRVFSDGVRSASHRVQERSRLELAEVAADAEAAAGASVAGRHVLDRLRPPPPFLVGVIFAAGSAPFAFHAGGPGLLALAIVGELALAAGADLVTRRLWRRRSGWERGVGFLAAWAAVGLAASLVAVALVDDRAFVPFIPLIAFPGLAVVTALCADAIHRGRVEARRLGRALRIVARSAADRSAGARRSLVHASDVLHGRVQGTCVILAAQVDDDEATPADIHAFERSLEAAFDDVLGEAAVGHSLPADLDETVAVWQPVIDVSSRVDGGAETALRDPAVSLRVVAVVAEGLVNAVKHAAARTANVDVATRASGELRVSVSSPGHLRAEGRLSGGLGLASLGPSARLFQRGGEVVLEVAVPVADGDGDADPRPALAERRGPRAGAGAGGDQARGSFQDSDSM